MVIHRFSRAMESMELRGISLKSMRGIVRVNFNLFPLPPAVYHSTCPLGCFGALNGDVHAEMSELGVLFQPLQQEVQRLFPFVVVDRDMREAATVEHDAL